MLNEDPQAGVDDDAFEGALETARIGRLLDWPLPQPVLDALADVAVDPTEANAATAQAVWEAERPS